MHTICAMMALRITPTANDELAEADGLMEAGGVTVSIWDHLDLSYAFLHLMVAPSIAHITEK